MMGCDRVQRWKLELKDYNYEIIYKEGKLNKNADTLSRNPVLTITYNKLNNTHNINMPGLFAENNNLKIQHHYYCYGIESFTRN